MLKYVFACLLALASVSLAAPNPADWPNWRGPAGNGSLAGGQYPTRWTVADAAWKLALPGKGVSTPITWQGRVYLTTPSEGQDAVLAVDRTGRQLWLTKLGPESPPRHRTLASSCNASPVTDGRGIFVRFRSGRLAALEMDGRVRWQSSLDERFGPEKLYWDTGSSPALTEKHLVVARMHNGESWVAGFDRDTGEQRWLQPRNFQTPPENDNGYSTPVFFQQGDRRAFLLWGADHLTAHAAADGALLWTRDGFNPGRQGLWPAIATPVVEGNVAVVAAGRDDRPGQARMHGIGLDGARIWQRDDLGVFCCSPIAHKGRVYLLRHRGGVVCLDPATGKTIWEEAFPRGSASFYASPIIAGGTLYAAREDGTVFTARVEDRFELLGENAMGERIVATPVPFAGRLLIRGEQNLYCVAVPKP